MTDEPKWLRSRFVVEHPDYRPLKWPPPGPYWCTGYNSEDWPIVVAYTRTREQVVEFWPEAIVDDNPEECDAILFTSRFPRPDWWPKSEQVKP